MFASVGFDLKYTSIFVMNNPFVYPDTKNVCAIGSLKFAVDGFTVVIRSTDNSLGDVERANVIFGARVDASLPVSYVIAPYDENVVIATQSVCAAGLDALLVTTNILTPVLNVSGGTRNTPEISPEASVSNVDP